MQDPPSAVELIEAVQGFLEQTALPELEGRAAFHARVAINALAIVARELQHAPAANHAETLRLRHLLSPSAAPGAVESLSLLDLNRELCRRIRAGEIGLENAELCEHLWQTTLAKRAIDAPPR
ncbi:MAG TPA: DUF6285 domain-containing protein [Terriglobales bacterium]|nr:DUF6285 domain-containing protein [Terriglobales bacterium]